MTIAVACRGVTFRVFKKPRDTVQQLCAGRTACQGAGFIVKNWPYMRIRQALIVTGFFSLYILLSQAAFAGRPLVVDDARPVAEKNVQFSIGFTHTVPQNGGLDQQAPAMTLGFGVVKNLELGLTLDRIN